MSHWLWQINCGIVFSLQLLGIHEKHGYHAIVIYLKRDQKESKFISKHYATPGFAEEYFGSEIKKTEDGEKLIRTMKEKLEGRDFLLSKVTVDTTCSNSG